MKSEEPAVQFPGFFFKNVFGDVDARLLQFKDSPAIDGGEGVSAGDDNLLDAVFDDQIGAGRGLSKMGAGFQRNIEC